MTQGALVVYMMYKVVHNPCEQMTQGNIVEYKVSNNPCVQVTQGAMAEYMVYPEKALVHKVPDEVSGDEKMVVLFGRYQ